MNKIILIGRLTQETNLQYTPNGVAYVRNCIATQRDFKNQDGGYDTDFINFVAYKQQAELIVKHFNKGDRIGLVGRLQVDKYQDQYGNAKTSYNVVVSEIEFLQDKKQEATEPTPAPSEEPTEFEVDENDLPF